MRSKTFKKHKKCVNYKKCEYVPCDAVKNGCKPSYCTPGSSRNWSKCNMGIHSECRDETKCTMSKRNKTINNTVRASVMHSKFPLIWRFLKPKTRKHMIHLANKPRHYLNLDFHVFPDKKYNTKNMSRKNALRYKTLRRKYKDI